LLKKIVKTAPGVVEPLECIPSLCLLLPVLRAEARSEVLKVVACSHLLHVALVLVLLARFNWYIEEAAKLVQLNYFILINSLIDSLIERVTFSLHIYFSI